MSKRLESALAFTGVTDIGCVRTRNEDCIAWDAKLGLAILADGIGGANAGDIAGQITAETILKEIREEIDNLSYSLLLVDDGEMHNRASIMLKNALLKANCVVHRIAHDQPECGGMGATALAVLFYDNKISVGHAGDSRLYMMRDGQLSQLTEDHTVLQEILNSGTYNTEDAENTANKNIVTRAIGIAEELIVDILEQPVLPGDLYMLCSDGLTGPVSDGEIHALLRSAREHNALAQDLVDLANSKGGNDNVSVILVKVLKPFQAKRSLKQRIIDRFL